VSSIKNTDIFVLIYVVSLVLQSPISLNIHNQGQSINLISPVYFVHGGKWHTALDQEIHTNVSMRSCIEFDSGQDILEGALVYKIQKMETSFLERECSTQRKRAKIDKLVQDESRHIQLLVAWRVEHTKELNVRALLVEHDGELDEHKLRILYQKYWHLLNAQVDPIKSKWQLNDTTVKTKIKTMNGDYRWDILISDKEEYSAKRPFWIDTTR
jgi:hypothetical protein